MKSILYIYYKTVSIQDPPYRAVDVRGWVINQEQRPRLTSGANPTLSCCVDILPLFIRANTQLFYIAV